MFHHLRVAQELLEQMGHGRGSDGFYLGLDGQPMMIEILGLANPTWESELAIVVEGYRRIGLNTTSRILASMLFGDGQARAYAQFGPRRITIRVVHPGGESARELPAMGAVTLVDDSVFALHAVPPARRARQAVAVRSGARLPVEVLERGVERTAIQGIPRDLRHEVLRTGSDERHLWYDQDGKLMKVEAPGVSLTAERESR